jgi:GTP diphosphokinase / guanosine-3',5'-bis(diphosphate) 3'-diphosphatase
VIKNANYFSKYRAYVEKYREYEKRDPEDIFEELMKECDHMSKNEKELIKKSYIVAKRWHKNQPRKSGAPYITHPLTVACMMLPYKPSAVLIWATLLHDTLEDTTETFETIREIHPDIADIVEGATKICGNDYERQDNSLSKEQARFETIRKILITSQKNIGILFLKIFDRCHNMITVDAMSPEWRQRIAEETHNVYVPLSKRCGLREINHFLESLTTEILEREKWITMETFVTWKESVMRENADKIHTYLKKQNWSKPVLHYDMEFLSPFSVESKKLYIEESWYAVQIIVHNPNDCYMILNDIGVRQDENFLQVGHVIDLINNPRLSGYTGLHTEIIFEGISRIKVHIIDEKTYQKILSYETFENLGHTYAPVLFRDFDLINEATASDSGDFIKSITEHILARKIRIHSKTRHLFYMPIKSTVLDAVIYLEPQLFHSIEHIYRNHEKVPFYTLLEEDDIITFSLADKETISKKWIKSVSSGITQWRIESYLHIKK